MRVTGTAVLVLTPVIVPSSFGRYTCVSASRRIDDATVCVECVAFLRRLARSSARLVRVRARVRG